MKKRKSSFLQKIMSVLLSVVLIVAMASNAMPMPALANEPEELQETSETLTEEETETETVSEDDVGTATVEEPQCVVMTETTAAQTNNIASGSDWVLDADGRLTISSDTGMENWIEYLSHIKYANKQKVKSVMIQNGVTIIGNNAFDECSTMTSITIPDSVTTIGERAFYFCDELEEVVLPNNLKSIGAYAFFKCFKLKSIAIPDSVTSIGRNAFFECNALAGSITIPSGMKGIAEYTFYGCNSLTGITIPDSVTSIGNGAFHECNSLTEITIPSGVTTIGDGAFRGCSSVTGSITIPSGVTTIGTDLFYGCSGLTEITMPENVTIIGSNAFRGCTGLKHITIPAGVTTIGHYAFDDCTGLTRIVVPADVTEMCTGVFYDCSNLEAVIMLGETPPTILTWLFKNCKFYTDKVPGIYVPAGRVDAYETAWKEWKGYIIDAPAPAEPHEHDGVVFTQWTQTDSLPDTDGNYYLTENITLSGTWNVPNGETTLCLNGKTIRVSGERVITIPSHATLNLYDCQDTGTITGASSGGIYNSGTLHLYDGKISGNGSASHGGGVYMYGMDAAFYMGGGEISGNTSDMGGGVYVESGTFTIGGNVVISGNTCDGTENNVYLKNGQMITIDSQEPLSDLANIGITTETAPADGNPVNITGTNGADYSSYFTSDNEAYAIAERDHDHIVQLILVPLQDTEPPMGRIKLEAHSWASFLHTITFRLFFKETKQVTIEAQDADSGVDKIYYYISDSGLTEAQVNALGADAWTEGTSCSIDPNRKCVIYAKITDKAGNVTYLSSNGLVFDAIPPVISGVTNGETYNEPQVITVTDAMSGIKSVTINGTEVTPAGNIVSLETAENPQTIIATDHAGNTTTVTVTIEAESHIHDYGDWQHNNTQHWQKCSCGDEAGRANHNFGDWVTDREATAAETGTKHRECQTCHYRETRTIPTAGTEPESGIVTLVVKPIDNAPITSISSPTEEVKDMLLTDEEKQQVQNGTDIRIVLEVRDAGNTVSSSEQAAVQQDLNEFVVGQYLNINLYKLAGTERTNITKTVKKIRIVITVPEALRNTDENKTRTFAVSRVHDGSAELLNDMDENTDTITIETDRFSTYAIVYKDISNDGDVGENNGNGDNNDGGDDTGNTSNNSSENNTGNTSNTGSGNDSTVSANNSNQSSSEQRDSDSSKTDKPMTGDTAKLELYATLAMISCFSYLLLYFVDWKGGMTEETKKELVTRLVGWAKRGGRIRKCLALSGIFVLLLYYHSIGKNTCTEWKEMYGE